MSATQELKPQQIQNPYVGPGPFSRRDDFRFFGRKREIADLQSLVAAHRTVLLYAQSGAGKTSILNAGLIPELEKKGFDALVGGRIAQAAPKERVKNIFTFNTFSNLASEGTQPTDLATSTIGKILQSRPRKKVLRSDKELRDRPRVLVLDQFEEMFRYHSGRWQERRAFFDDLTAAMHTEPTLRILFALREDFIANLEPYQDLLPEGLRTRYRLEMLRPEAALLAVEDPLIGTGIKFAEGVAERLVTDLRTTPGSSSDKLPDENGSVIQPTENVDFIEEFIEPVQLQVVCFSLFKSLKPGSRQITDSDRIAFGDVDRALQEFYELALSQTAEKTGITIDELRRWFENAMITADGTRGLAFQGRNTTAGLPNTTIKLLDQSFHIIRPEVRKGGTWYELSHDRFILPILRANDNWRTKMREKERFALESKAKRSKKAATLAALATLVFAVVTSFALWEKIEANVEARKATSRQLAAQAIDELWQNPRLSAQIALKAWDTFETNEAEKALKAALSQVNVRAVLATPDNSPLSGAAFSRSGNLIATSSFWQETRLWNVATAQSVMTFPSSYALRISGDSLSPDDQYLLIGSKDDDRKVEIVSLAERRVLGTFVASTIGGIKSAVFSQTGQYIATAGEDYVAAVWETDRVLDCIRLSTNHQCKWFAPRFSKALHSDIINSVRFSKDEQYLLTASQDGRAKIWQWRSNKRIELRRYSTALFSAEFDPTNNNIVLTSGQNPDITRWVNVFSKPQLSTVPGHGLDISSISFDPSGQRFLTTSYDGTAAVWNLQDMKRRFYLKGHRGALTGGAFNPSGKAIVTASVDGTARIWSAAPVPNIESDAEIVHYLRTTLSSN